MRYRSPTDVRKKFGAKARRALIITTVTSESRAVQSHLVDTEILTGSKGRIYEYGRFPDPDGDWQVVHALTAQGNSDAGLVTDDAHHEFGKFDVVMFVGVGGSLKEDIPIGSVVAGDYVYNAHSSKVEDKGTLSRSRGQPAAPELLAAAQTLIYTGEWANLIKPPTDMKELPKEAEYPGGYPPVGFIKAIVSGEAVIAGGKSREYARLRKDFSDAGAVEMEGWGVAKAAHSQNSSAIIVRGISDMCAGKSPDTDKLNQPIAAVHAAAFAFSILSFRSRAMPADPESSVVEEMAQAAKAAAPDPRIDFTLNMKGTKEEWPAGKVQTVVDHLKEFLSDPDLRLVRVESGSVRIVVNIRACDVPKLDMDELRTGPLRLGAQLLGATTSQQVALADAAKALLRIASADLLAWEKTLPGGGWIERPERHEIESRFAAPNSSTVLLGPPGSGKSALLSKLAADLIAAGMTVFALKADFLSPEIHNEDDLGKSLLLPAKPSDLILQLAQLQPVYVLIDQLDALASQLDLQSDRLNVLLNLVRRIGGAQNVHLVLSARTFEFNHDVRLRAVEAEAVTLVLPPWHEVKEKLAAANIDAETWPEAARDVVRIPQALKTYLTLANARACEPFTTYQSMLEHLWHERIGSAKDSEFLAALASDLAGQMAEDETLWLATAKFDDRIKALNRLEALGFLVKSENGMSVAFSHQTVFDFVLARTFVRTAGLLSTYVLERQDSLFVRAKLWSALNYLREAEVGSYEREFLAIWRTKDLRRHLRLLLIEFLGQQAQPLDFEKICLEEIVNTDLRLLVLKAIATSPGWFSTFARTAIRGAMTGSDAEAGQVLRMFATAWTNDPEEVVRLLKEQWLPVAERDGFTWSAIQDCPTWTDEIEGMARIILARSPISIWQVEHAAETLAVDQPMTAIRLVKMKLEYLLEEAKKSASTVPFPSDGTTDQQMVWHLEHGRRKPFEALLDSMDWHGLPTIAETYPADFVDTLWGWYLSLFEALISRSETQEGAYIYPGQWVVELDLDETRANRREEPMKTSLRLAVEGFADADPEAFATWAEANGDVEILAVQQLIARGFEVGADRLAEKAFAWLLADHRRFQLGSRFGHRDTTVALVRAAAPHWSDAHVQLFEQRVIDYRPPTPSHLDNAERRKIFADNVRSSKMEILKAIDPERLGNSSLELIATERRALGDRFERSIGDVEGGWIGSPMEATEMAKAKDRDILKILNEVPDDTNWDHPTHWMRGGNIQLSRAFAEFAKANPERGLRLMDQFEPRRQERAAGYALDAMADDGVNDHAVMEALLDLHRRGFKADEFKDSVGRAIEKIANRKAEVGEETIGLLIDWLKVGALEDADNEATQLTDTDDDMDTKDDERLKDESVIWALGGATTLPQGNFNLLSALTSILLSRKEEGRDRLIAIFEEHLARETNPNVWKALLYRLSNAGGSAPAVVSDFLRKLFARWPKILTTRSAIIFLAYAQRWDDQLVFDLISEWPGSDRPILKRAYGELVGLVAMAKGGDKWKDAQAAILSTDSGEAKLGLAYAAANLWSEPDFHEKAGVILAELVHGAESRRIGAIMEVFRLVDDLVPDTSTVALLKALADPATSLAGAPAHFVVERLQSLLPHQADLVAAVATKLVAAWRDELGDIRTGTVTAAPQLTDLALTLHRLGGPSREAGVTIFEAMIEIDAYGARDTLQEVDGRFGPHPVSARRRLPRRTRSNRVGRGAA